MFKGKLNIQSVDRAGADIFVSIVTVEHPQYDLAFKLTVENKKGKKIFRHKINIPTRTDSLSFTYIPDIDYISAEDFQRLYELGLKAVFENEKNKFEKQYVTRPVHREYVDFYARSIQFILIIEKDKYILEDENGEITEPASFILKGKGKGVKGGFAMQIGKKETKRKYKKYSFLHNKMLNEEYITLTKGNTGGVLCEGCNSVTVDFEYADTTIGQFELKSDGFLDGHLAETNYSISRISPIYPFYEILWNDNLVAILRYGHGEFDILNILNSIPAGEQGRLINVIFAWEEAMRMNGVLNAD